MAALQGLRRSFVSMQAADPKLANLIQEEKDVLKSLANIEREKQEATKFFTAWGNIEHADIKDICDRTAEITKELQPMFSELSSGYTAYRESLKEINRRGESVHTIQSKQKHLQDKLAQAIRSKKPHDQTQSELAIVKKDALNQAAEFESAKRALLRDGLDHQFNALLDFGRQLIVIGMFGKYMAGQIPQGKLAPGQELPLYKGGDVTKQIVADFSKELADARGRRCSNIPRNSSTSSVDLSRRNTIMSVQSGSTSMESVAGFKPLAMQPQQSLPVQPTYMQTQQQPLDARGVSPKPAPPNSQFSYQNAGYDESNESVVYGTLPSTTPGAFPTDAARRGSYPQSQLQQGSYPYQQPPPTSTSLQEYPGSANAHTQQQHQATGVINRTSTLQHVSKYSVQQQMRPSAPPLQSGTATIPQSGAYQQQYLPQQQPQQYQHRPHGYSSTVQLPPPQMAQQQMGYGYGQPVPSDRGGNETASLTSTAPPMSAGMGGQPDGSEPTRCGACGHAVNRAFLADHRASGCVTHITAL